MACHNPNAGCLRALVLGTLAWATVLGFASVQFGWFG